MDFTFVMDTMLTISCNMAMLSLETASERKFFDGPARGTVRVGVLSCPYISVTCG